MWVTKLLISQVKKRIFCPKLAFLVNLGQAMQAYSVPCWCVGWWLWRAGCISQDTYLLYLKNERAFQNLFSLGGDARVLQRCPRPGDQVSSLQGVCSLPFRRRQLLNNLSNKVQNSVQIITANKVQKAKAVLECL